MDNSHEIIDSAAELASQASEALLASLSAQRELQGRAYEALASCETLLMAETTVSAEGLGDAERALWAGSAEVSDCHKSVEATLASAEVGTALLTKVMGLLHVGAEHVLASAELLDAETALSAECLDTAVRYIGAERDSFSPN